MKRVSTAGLNWTVQQVRRLGPTRGWRCLVVLALLVISWWLIAPDPTAGTRLLRQVQLAFRSGYLIHFCVYGFVTVLVLSALVPWKRRSLQLTIGLLLMHALLTEFLQTFVPTRYPDPLDACANLAGIVTALWIVRKFRRLVEQPGGETGRVLPATAPAQPVLD